MKLPIIQLCKGTCAPVVPLSKVRGRDTVMHLVPASLVVELRDVLYRQSSIVNAKRNGARYKDR